MSKIRVAIAGLGNCASGLLQGVEYYRRKSQDKSDGTGLMHATIGSYRVSDIEVAAAFDIDKRKVGKRVGEAIYAPPNNTMCICPQLQDPGPIVQMGPLLDGFAEHMLQYPEHQRFMPSDQKPVDVAAILRDGGADILVNYLPVSAYLMKHPPVQMKDAIAREEIERFLDSLRPVVPVPGRDRPAPSPLIAPAAYPAAKATTPQVQRNATEPIDRGGRRGAPAIS